MDSINTFVPPADGKTGGYDVNLKKTLLRKWICPLCNKLMKDAIQTYRGEMACESCFLVAKGDSNMCPLDNEPIENGEYFKDRHARREILQLECYCLNKGKGCVWEGVVNHLADHNTNCDYEIISCVDCLEHLQRRLMAEHGEHLCPFRKVNCPHCDTRLDAQSIKEHEPTCHLKPVACPYGCGKPIRLNNLLSHVETCGEITEGHICPYQLVGCTHKPNNTEGLNDHLQTDMTVHAALTISTVKNLEEQNANIKQELLTEQTLRIQLAKKLEQHSTSQKTMEDDVIKWKEKFLQMETEFVRLQDMCKVGVNEVTQHLDEMHIRFEQNDFETIDAKLTEVTLHYDEVENTLKNNLGPAHATASVGLDSEEMKQGAAKIDQLERGSAVLTANLAELELKLQLLENTSYEGQQLWKVDNVTYRMNHAITGSVSALHSAPCFQKRGGYKFCSRLYLNGDGMGRGTHVSLFFVVMKSEYDALLQWPFSQRVTFRLINPYNREESVRESFIPDKNSSSFKRPTKDMNIAAGCPMFIRKELLSNFIIDDTLYIETIISSE